MLSRSLVLRREALAPLTTGELGALAAAGGGSGPQPTPPIYAPRTLDLDECVGPTFHGATCTC